MSDSRQPPADGPVSPDDYSGGPARMRPPPPAQCVRPVSYDHYSGGRVGSLKGHIAVAIACVVGLLVVGFGLWFGGSWVFSKFSSERPGNAIQQPIVPAPAAASPAPDAESPMGQGTTPGNDK